MAKASSKCNRSSGLRKISGQNCITGMPLGPPPRGEKGRQLSLSTEDMRITKN
jgi:hypothetical protein